MVSLSSFDGSELRQLKLFASVRTFMWPRNENEAVRELPELFHTWTEGWSTAVEPPLQLIRQCLILLNTGAANNLGLNENLATKSTPEKVPARFIVST